MTMTVRKLVPGGDGSYRVTLPKEELQQAGIVHEDGDPDGEVFVKTDGDGLQFSVEVLDL